MTHADMASHVPEGEVSGPWPNGAPPSGDHLTVVIPPSARYVRAVRLFAAASMSGMDVDQLQDLRLLIDECWSAMLEVTLGPVRLDLDVEPNQCRAITSATWSGAHVEMNPMRAAIVALLADSHRFERIGDRVEFEFVFTTEPLADGDNTD